MKTTLSIVTIVLVIIGLSSFLYSRSARAGDCHGCAPSKSKFQ